MRLYLVRHGEAQEAELDPDRHLTDRGRRDVEKVAAFLKPLGLTVKIIWHSGKPRAQQTAEILAQAVAADEGLLRRKGLLPNDSVELVADELDEHTSDLMIVGHLPFLGKLAAVLLVGEEGGEPIAFEKAAIVCLETGEDQPWQVKWMLVPELMG